MEGKKGKLADGTFDFEGKRADGTLDFEGKWADGTFDFDVSVNQCSRVVNMNPLPRSVPLLHTSEDRKPIGQDRNACKPNEMQGN